MNLAKVSNLENQMDSAKFFATQSLNFKAKELPLLITTYSTLSEIEEKLGHDNESLQYFKKFNTYVTKVIDENKNKTLLELQKKYDFEKQKSEGNQRVIKQQKMAITFFIAFIIALIIASFSGIKLYRSEKSLSEAELKIESLKKMGADYLENAKSVQLEAERKVENVNKINEDYLAEIKSVRNILLEHFNILKKVALIKENIRDEDKKDATKLMNKFNKIVYDQDSLDWEKLYQIINSLHNGLYDKVRKMYPQLNSDEFRICYLSSVDFSDTDLSILFGKEKWSITKIEKMRSIIRKKIGVGSYGNIHDFFVKKLR
jgi:ABC-type multidrug transport system fused ATPase/permease subunit